MHESLAIAGYSATNAEWRCAGINQSLSISHASEGAEGWMSAALCLTFEEPIRNTMILARLASSETLIACVVRQMLSFQNPWSNRPHNI